MMTARGPAGGGGPRRLAAMAARLTRLRAAQDKLAARALASARSPQSRIAAAQAAAEAAARRLEQAEAAQAATMEKYHAAVAAGKPWRFGTIPVPAENNKRILQLRERAVDAAARLSAISCCLPRGYRAADPADFTPAVRRKGRDLPRLVRMCPGYSLQR